MSTEVTIRFVLGPWQNEGSDQRRREWLTGVPGSLETAALVFRDGSRWVWRAWYPVCPQHEEGTAPDEAAAKRASEDALERLVARRVTQMAPHAA
jgi:hypothetical protein